MLQVIKDLLDHYRVFNAGDDFHGAAEYDADLDAATLTGNPRSLASALAKMERLRGSWLERLFLSGRRPQEPSVFRTHPDTGDRIRRLLELEAGRRPDREGDDRRWGHNRPRRSRPPIIPGRGL